jgi:hypothetical protein
LPLRGRMSDREIFCIFWGTEVHVSWLATATWEEGDLETLEASERQKLLAGEGAKVGTQ